MSMFQSSGILCMLLLLFSCSHHSKVLSPFAKKLVLESADRLAIQHKSPRFVVDSQGLLHVAAVSFNGEDSERLEYFQHRDNRLHYIGHNNWYRISLHQLIQYQGIVWALVSGRRSKPDTFRQIYLIDLQNHNTVIQLSKTNTHHINPSAITYVSNGQEVFCLSSEEWLGANAKILVACLPSISDTKKIIATTFSQKNTLLRRPTIAWHDNQLVVAWDQWRVERKPLLTDPDYDIYSARLKPLKNALTIVTAPHPLIAGEALTAAPQLQAVAGKLLLAFHSNHRHGLLKHWELVQINGKNLLWMEIANRTLHNQYSEESQGNEFPVFDFFSSGENLSWAMLTRPAHGATLLLGQTTQVQEWEMDQDGWGARDLVGQILWIKQNEILLARRGHKQATLEWIQLGDLNFNNASQWQWRPGTNHLPAPQALHRPLFFNPTDKNVFYGDVHTHSGFSDGTGPNDEIYARLYQRGLHFSVLTDHDNIVGSRLFPQQHEENQIITDWFDNIFDFTTLQAFEWTTPPLPRGHGHKNIYFENNSVNPVFSFKGEQKDVPSLYQAMDKTKSFAAPHHTAWTGIDWHVHQEKFEPQFEIASVHGVYETLQENPFKTSGDMPGMFARDGLKLNKKIGFMAGSDAHGLLEHHGKGRAIDPWGHGLTGVRLSKLNRSNLWHALHDKRTWATTGTPITIENKIVKSHGQDTFVYSVVAPDVITSIELVIDGGRVILHVIIPAGQEKMTMNGEWPINAYIGQGQHSFYLRVLTKGEKVGGEGAFSSPLWIASKN